MLRALIFLAFCWASFSGLFPFLPFPPFPAAIGVCLTGGTGGVGGVGGVGGLTGAAGPAGAEVSVESIGVSVLTGASVLTVVPEATVVGIL